VLRAAGEIFVDKAKGLRDVLIAILEELLSTPLALLVSSSNVSSIFACAFKLVIRLLEFLSDSLVSLHGMHIGLNKNGVQNRITKPVDKCLNRHRSPFEGLAYLHPFEFSG
jgi:hypothetical protein